MLIHYYYNPEYDLTHPHVCSFYIPWDPKFDAIKNWLQHTYDQGVKQYLHHGEVRFCHERDAALFVLKWS